MSTRYFDQCFIEREKVKTFYHWNCVTGVRTFDRTETVVEPCGTPLFGEKESKRGICKSCEQKWMVEGNIITRTGLLQLADAKPIKRGDRNAACATDPQGQVQAAQEAGR